MGASAAVATTPSPTTHKVHTVATAAGDLPLRKSAAATLGSPGQGLATTFLDGLRGLAAFYVLMRHVTWVPAPTSTRPAWLHVLTALRHAFFYGHMAVVFFFVLSGFVIHLRYARHLKKDAATARFGWGEFVWRRIR